MFRQTALPLAYLVASVAIASTLCQDAIRLTGSSLYNMGVIEVLHNGIWGTVCDDYFDQNNNGAKVACRQLGFPTPNSGVFIGRGSSVSGVTASSQSKIWMDDVVCGGSEAKLEYCQFGGWGNHNCGHGEDSIICCPADTMSPCLNIVLPRGSYDRIYVMSLMPSSNAIVAFWPLDYVVSSNRLIDVVGYYDGFSSGITSNVGPFGKSSASFKPSSSNTSLFEASTELSLSTSFTISFFLLVGSTGTENGWGGGIFEFVNKQNYATNTLQMRYVNGTTLEVSAMSRTVGSYQMVQPANGWTFLAFTFEEVSEMFTVYSRYGVFKPATFEPHIWSAIMLSDGGFRLGKASRWSQSLQTSDAISCLSMYNTVLKTEEIRQLQDACRYTTQSTPCGTTKVALTTIPAVNAVAATPKAGQFPQLASIRFGALGHICSANILDEFWLVTASTCFQENTNPSAYTVTIGEYDVSVNESYSQLLTVSKIILSNGSNQRGIALVQVTTPINLNSDYANDACFFNGNYSIIDMTAFMFVPGWGRNGRTALTSQSLPRYVPGRSLPPEQCALAWGNDFDANYDFCFMSSASDKNVPCGGDEGSPLLATAPADDSLKIGDRLITLGIYYQRDLNCTAAKPGLFVNIAKYRDWINEKLACAVANSPIPAQCPQS